MNEPQNPAPHRGADKAPSRHPVAWRDPAFYDREKLFGELERVFEICHGCRRCFNLCNAFPTLFDLIDECESMDLDGVPKEDYWRVVDHCYLCDLCFMTKCPYVPPHEWEVDFPHLMLRAKALRHRDGKDGLREKMLSSTDTMGKISSLPVLAPTINAANRSRPARVVLEKTLGVHRGALLPEYHTPPMRKRLQATPVSQAEPRAATGTRGRVALFATCYGNYNDPRLGVDLAAVFEHNGIPVRLAEQERCCGMPKLEMGDLEAVAQAKEINIPVLAALVDEGWDLIAPVPSCVLMFKQELPLLFPDDADVAKVAAAFFDPFEYLALRHREGLLNLEFKQPLGRVAYHAACHQRVQNFGGKTRDVLALIPDTTVIAIERCSGHDGTYAVKREFHETAMKIVRPVVKRVLDAKADHYTSDCAMAGRHIQNGLARAGKGGGEAVPPMSLLRLAYGI